MLGKDHRAIKMGGCVCVIKKDKMGDSVLDFLFLLFVACCVCACVRAGAKCVCVHRYGMGVHNDNVFS